MKVLLLRANELRHRALASILQSAGFLSAEIVEDKALPDNETESELIHQHLKAREQSEIDFFGYYSKFEPKFSSLKLNSGELNSSFTLEFVKNQVFDLAISFGVSILKSDLIKGLRNNVLGIHLGLSPYYRGSGTNFFPFVNSELGAIGYTLMHLDLGIDSGPIVHQGRAPIVLGDSIHTIGNRNISLMFGDILKLMEENLSLESTSKQRLIQGKIYKRKDFNEKNLKKALENLSSGLVTKYLSDINKFQKNFPLIQYNFHQFHPK